MFSKFKPHLLTGMLLTAITAIALSVGASAPLKDNSKLEERANAALDLDRSQVQDLTIEQIDADSFSTTVVIDGQPHVLDMVRHSLRSPNFELKVQYEDNGPLVTVDAPPARTFRGEVRDMPGSEVRLTYADDSVTGIVILPDERVFGVEPLNKLDIDAPAQRHVVYDSADWRNSDGYECGVDAALEQFGFVNPEPQGDRQAAGSGDDITEIGLDSDGDYYDDNGQDVTNTMQAMETILNNTAGVYEVTPINITYELTVIIVRTTNGSYTSTSAGTLLCQFRSEWNSAPENLIQRDVAHLFTGKNLDGTTIGIAWVGRVCNLGGFTCGQSGSMAYGVSQNVSGTTSRTALTAHELGHNWNSPHCNSSADCRIMCSGLGGCDGLSPLTFAPDPENTIINFKNASGCLSPLGPPQSLPLCEEFTNASFDTDRWSYIDGAVISGAASNPPSPPFALQLNAGGSSLYLDDEIRTNFVLMAGMFDVELSFFTQHQGVEAGEELVIEYLDIIDRWIELDRITSDGVDQTEFVFHSYMLPVPAGHNDFRLRFRTEVDSSGDNWYIDNIGLDCFCEAPCSDNNACTIGDDCVDVTCVGTPVDCSGASSDCVVASCDPAGADGNCDVLEPTNEGGSCNGGSGFCSDGACLSPNDTARVYMARDGEQNGGADVGSRSLTMIAGTSTRIMMWLDDNSAPGSQLNAYQLLLPMSATPLNGAPGTVEYVNNLPGSPELGDSILVDTTRGDWVFADEPAVLTTFYTESDALGLFGMLYTTISGFGPDPSTMDNVYLAEFDLIASAGAEGEFELKYNLDTPPLTTFFDPVGGDFGISQFQSLIINVVEGGDGCPNGTIAECADLDMNEVRDDNCIWYECSAGTCLGTDIVFADMGGQFGDCPPDGTADGNDRFHALNCFANIDPDTGGDYNCEDAPPAAFNVDAGGQFGSCDPDGVCDGNDAFAALNAFGGTTSCSCPLDGGPSPVVEPVEVNRAGFNLQASRKAVRPGQLIEVQVDLDRMLPDLRGYQLHVAASGGARGTLDLVDIAVPTDGVFTSDWTAFNVATRQMVAGRDADGMRVEAGTLATFTFRASKDAAGRFAVEVLTYDALHPEQRSFLFPTESNGMIAIDAGRPLTIDVRGSQRIRSAR